MILRFCDVTIAVDCDLDLNNTIVALRFGQSRIHRRNALEKLQAPGGKLYRPRRKKHGVGWRSEHCIVRILQTLKRIDGQLKDRFAPRCWLSILRQYSGSERPGSGCKSFHYWRHRERSSV